MHTKTDKSGVELEVIWNGRQDDYGHRRCRVVEFDGHRFCQREMYSGDYLGIPWSEMPDESQHLQSQLASKK